MGNVYLFLPRIDVRQPAGHGDRVRVPVGRAAVRIPPVQNHQDRPRQEIRRPSQQRDPLRRVLDIPGEVERLPRAVARHASTCVSHLALPAGV